MRTGNNYMKKLFAITLFSLMVPSIFGQEVKHYDLNVDVDVLQRKIDVNGTVDVDFQGQDSLTLVLWENTTIQSIIIDNERAVYSFDTAGESPIYYIPDGGKLVLRNIQGKHISLPVYFAYSCDMKHVTGWAKSFTEDWIELGYYTAWYPVHSESRAFTSKITISIDPGYKVSGSGIVKQVGNEWIMTHDWPVFDNVIIASRNLKSKQIGGDDIGLELVYTDFPEGDLDSVSMVCQEIYEFYSHIFGEQENAYLKYVFNPLEGRGGYSRNKFVSIKASGFDDKLKAGMAHEMAHFWWNRAVTTTWEDWLNEAFAEYSMLLYLREKDSEETFSRLITRYKEQTKDSSPIWGIDRGAPEAYNALYFKGSLILVEFEEKLGTEDFEKFLGTLIVNQVRTTADFLNLVETELSKKYRDWFEKMLKT